MKILIKSNKGEKIEEILNKLVSFVTDKQDELAKHNTFANACWFKNTDGYYELNLAYYMENPIFNAILKTELKKSLRKVDKNCEIK